MKRKRGHKKKKPTQPTIDVVMKSEESPIYEGVDNAESDSPMEVEASPSMGSDEKLKYVEEVSGKPVAQAAGGGGGGGHGRVKVKLKSTKLLDAYPPMQSDTDNSSPQLGLEKQGEVVEKVKDGVNSGVPELQSYSSRKAGSIKIKSRGLGSSSTIMNPTVTPTTTKHLQGQGERNIQNVYKQTLQTYQREHKFSHPDRRYNENEVNAALMVIKKVMKMEAADPFNAPVDPIAFGIPDYFDVIKTPMDFGTICKNLEHGNVYMNSEDVYKDVQYIWENCYRYNNKGDYILDLMKRVKKNFMKYWMQAGLYSDQPNRTSDAALDQDSGIELPPEDAQGKDEALESGGRMAGSKSIQVEMPVPSNRERLYVKSTSSKHKPRRRHGINKHKSGCLCAVCVVRRRRQEREGKARIVEKQIEISNGNTNKSQEFRQEEASENPGSENATSHSDCSPDPDVNTEFEEGLDVKLDIQPARQEGPQQEKKSEDGMEIQKTAKSESGEEHNHHSQSEEMEYSGFTMQTSDPRGDTPLQLREEETQKLLQKQHESQETQKQAKTCKNFYANPSIVELCGSLFSNDNKSLWHGPNSLARHDVPVRRSSALHAAMATFMK